MGGNGGCLALFPAVGGQTAPHFEGVLEDAVVPGADLPELPQRIQVGALEGPAGEKAGGDHLIWGKDEAGYAATLQRRCLDSHGTRLLSFPLL